MGCSSPSPRPVCPANTGTSPVLATAGATGGTPPPGPGIPVGSAQRDMYSSVASRTDSAFQPGRPGGESAVVQPVRVAASVMPAARKDLRILSVSRILRHHPKCHYLLGAGAAHAARPGDRGPAQGPLRVPSHDRHPPFRGTNSPATPKWRTARCSTPWYRAPRPVRTTSTSARGSGTPSICGVTPPSERKPRRGIPAGHSGGALSSCPGREHGALAAGHRRYRDSSSWESSRSKPVMPLPSRRSEAATGA